MKLRASENGLVPPAFVALTLQKYVVLLNKPVMLEDVEVNPVRFTTSEPKLELVESCRLYESAPMAGFQLSVGVVEMPVAPADGATRDGIVGAPTIVVKFLVPEFGLAPPAFDALTLQ